MIYGNVLYGLVYIYQYFVYHYIVLLLSIEVYLLSILYVL